ncbi:uncharacterized protein TRIADDRAFT_58015 [Trichoplax adhaerens]|uniref:Carbohydrate kinase PfkB domain-containing protein n=1 Tax=Trichoplax adhaerens TaxID=10228 RepID=B3S2G3_TRIAD|nr:hypothetical protein TRIADDRAFT_58015 [Trichoplax adhaerens]EDV23092.1 hypothetical protein TRIADDRAFT_58015 [Trichoplax adhaerens]|eukprot:XP_002114002.1 hypothetical protein TRIADDRAFT_58015 [Trichoplax adhaerens]
MAMEYQHKQVLLVGLACLDIITVCGHFPIEDEDFRADDHYWQCGGNACNSAVVLQQLGDQCNLMACLSENCPQSDYILQKLTNIGIKSNWCIRHIGHKTPISTVLINKKNGSRTIMHYSWLPEITLDNFQNRVQFDNLDWIHFEGRRKNMLEIGRMMDYIRLRYKDRIKISVELEKKDENSLQLIPKADVIFIGKDFAQAFGHDNATDCLRAFYPLAQSPAIMICPWGDYGADGIGPPQSNIVHADALTLDVVVDTLAAGDTFLAGTIHSLRKGESLLKSISYGCKLAGTKCKQRGLMFEKIPTDH